LIYGKSTIHIFPVFTTTDVTIQAITATTFIGVYGVFS